MTTTPNAEPDGIRARQEGRSAGDTPQRDDSRGTTTTTTTTGCANRRDSATLAAHAARWTRRKVVLPSTARGTRREWLGRTIPVRRAMARYWHPNIALATWHVVVGWLHVLHAMSFALRRSAGACGAPRPACSPPFASRTSLAHSLSAPCTAVIPPYGEDGRQHDNPPTFSCPRPPRRVPPPFPRTPPFLRMAPSAHSAWIWHARAYPHACPCTKSMCGRRCDHDKKKKKKQTDAPLR